MLHVPDARIKEQILYVKTITVPQSRARKQEASFTLLHTGSPHSHLQTKAMMGPGRFAWVIQVQNNQL